MLLYYFFDTGYKYIEKFDFSFHHNYSEVFINNFSRYTIELAERLNGEYGTRLYRFEEGFGTYLDDFSFSRKRTYLILKFKDFISKLIGKPQIRKILNGTFFFSPELIQYKTYFNTYRIPHFNFNNMIFYQFVDEAFALPDKNEFDKKYIFFEENIPDGSIDDYDLVMKIAEKIGKDNLIVKLHPRRPTDRFSEQGIKVSKSIGIPWEAFLMKYDFSDKVVITISSSVAFSSRLNYNSKIKTYMLYNVVGNINPIIVKKKKFYSYITSFREKFPDDNFLVPNSLDEFLTMLKQ